VTRRVLFDATSLDALPSGTKTRLVLLAPELARRGYVVGVLHAPALDAATRGALGLCERIDVGRPRPRHPLLRRGFELFAYRHAAAAWRPDVVLRETWPMPAPPAGAALVPVIHDLRRLDGPPLMRAVFRRLLARGLARAARVHAVSEAVRAELAARGFDASKVDVVPNAVVPRDPAVVAAAPLPAAVAGRPFVFVVGHAEARKDFALCAAVAAAPGVAGRAQVVRAGRGTVGLPGVVELGPVDDATRDALLGRAAAVLAPSRLEGFGLVPLEALACGGRAVASDLAAHREVLGSAADYFAPGNAAEAGRLIAAVLDETPAARAARVAAGLARADLWSARRAADACAASFARLG
jgi:glycosyltransferase involved in cell wall biosynthesis